MKGMGEEEYYRNCPVCVDDCENCNYCSYEPVKPEQHEHRFWILSKRIVKKLFRTKYTEYSLRCLCGLEIKGVKNNQLENEM